MMKLTGNRDVRLLTSQEVLGWGLHNRLAVKQDRLDTLPADVQDTIGVLSPDVQDRLDLPSPEPMVWQADVAARAVRSLVGSIKRPDYELPTDVIEVVARYDGPMEPHKAASRMGLSLREVKRQLQEYTRAGIMVHTPNMDDNSAIRSGTYHLRDGQL